MKTILTLTLIFASLLITAQRGRAPKMKPLVTPGYYVKFRGDTVFCDIQTNPPDLTDFYKEFYVKPKRGKRLKKMNGRVAKAYGFDSRNFTVITYHKEKVFVERLATGKLNFFEYKYKGEIDGYPATESAYFIQNTETNGDPNAAIETKKMSKKFYKKNLKPYLKEEHPEIYKDLDKYSFDKKVVIDAINEYNK